MSALRINKPLANLRDEAVSHSNESVYIKGALAK
jgi:hypothetical protein